MAYDKTLPTNTTKIRNYPTVLTDNFAAIEEGDLSLKHWQVNFIERNAVPGAPPPANDPTRADDTMIFFSKQDGSGETEMFLMDDRNPANIIQLSEDGSMGSFSTTLKIDSFAFDSNFTYNEDYIVKAWAKCNSNGTFAKQRGFDSISGSGGLYTLTLLANVVTDANFCVVATADKSGGSERMAGWRNMAYDGGTMKGSFQINIFNGGGSNRTQDFTVMVMGT